MTGLLVMFASGVLLGIAIGFWITGRYYRARLRQVLVKIQNGMVLIIKRNGSVGELDLKAPGGPVLRPSMYDEFHRTGRITHAGPN